MFWSTLSALLALQGVAATPTPHSARSLKTSDKILNLRQAGVKADSSRALLDVLAASVTTPLIAVESGAGYAIDVSLGGDTFELIFDTGSSDLWVASTGVKCVNANGKAVAQSKCGFGPLFSGNFQEGKVAGENFNITYGDGEFLVGTLGYEDVTVAGITVKKQEIASVDEGYFAGTGDVSGIMGFAYSSLTSAYTGTNPAKDNPRKNNVHYKDWIANAINEGKIDSLFSVAIERGTNGGGGQVALGGLPTISFKHNFATTPLEMHAFNARHPIAKTHYTYYTITPDALVLDGDSLSTNFYSIVDTGTTLVYLPDDITASINSAFDPPSQEVQGLWINKCNATPPKFAVTIGGQDFTISGSELLLQGALGQVKVGGETYCVCGIQPGGAGPYILGDVFLKNVVAVFDVGNSEMRFAPHVNY